jgi:hypothetical protein
VVVVTTTRFLTVNLPLIDLLPVHVYVNLPADLNVTFALTVRCGFTVVRLPATTKTCESLPLFVILKVTAPTKNVLGATLTLESVPLTVTVVAVALLAEGTVAANAVATPAAPTTRSKKARRTRRNENLLERRQC